VTTVDKEDNFSIPSKKLAKVYVFSNQKGGVGKTTTAIAIAAGLAKNGHKTLLIDMDPQGNATSGVGIDKRSQEKTIYDCLHGQISLEGAIIQTEFKNLFLTPSNISLAGAELELSVSDRREYILSNLISKLRYEFEFVIIDCPPSLGLLTVNALVAASKLFIPLQCEYYALEGLGDLLHTFSLIREKLNPKLVVGGVILTMADFRANLTLQVVSEVRKHFGDKVFKSVIPRSVRISEAPSHGKPIIYYDPSNKGAKAYLEIVDEILRAEGLKKNSEPALSSEAEKINTIFTTVEAEKNLEEVTEL
jgi:chromosome partitioning protein